MKVYHETWLRDNPNVSRQQLASWLATGFDIHHLDGNHENNAPNNLILIWGADHMMLHNGSKRISRVVNFENRMPKVHPCGCQSHYRTITPCNGGEPFIIAKGAKPKAVVKAYHNLLGI